MLDKLPDENDSSSIISELRNRLEETESALANVRIELEDALEREQMVVQYNRELLVKIAEMDANTTLPTNPRPVRVVRSQSCGSISERSASPTGSNNDLADLIRENRELARAEQKDIPSAEAETSSRKPPNTEDRTVYFYTSSGTKVEGMVQSTSEGIMFGTFHALVRPSELIGIRSCSFAGKQDDPSDKRSRHRRSSSGEVPDKPKKSSFFGSGLLISPRRIVRSLLPDVTGGRWSSGSQPAPSELPRPTNSTSSLPSSQPHLSATSSTFSFLSANSTQPEVLAPIHKSPSWTGSAAYPGLSSLGTPPLAPTEAAAEVRKAHSRSNSDTSSLSNLEDPAT
eukprot:CAMPEP_0118935426 /NCGR_PEP_ID=MMETSP1169-20130426/15635_1 /TAXON_ID=36882 /ORGANISM="Pyramimonas obovata, Strain CCMP722" /LENGTH=340 /DNA_ID=CAMNT_0006878467 /DNA_START=267 /DNA_END=1285 /DNA_ORIENTATION=-